MWSIGRRGFSCMSNKYEPHQGPKERARRRKQIRAGQLSGKCGKRCQLDFVTEQARFCAHGLVHPNPRWDRFVETS